MLASDVGQSDSHIFFQILSHHFFLDKSFHLFLAERGVRCSGGLSLVAASRGSPCCRAQALSERASVAGSTGLAAQGMWDLPGQGIDSMSPVLQGEQ